MYLCCCKCVQIQASPYDYYYYWVISYVAVEIPPDYDEAVEIDDTVSGQSTQSHQGSRTSAIRGASSRESSNGSSTRPNRSESARARGPPRTRTHRSSSDGGRPRRQRFVYFPLKILSYINVCKGFGFTTFQNSIHLVHKQFIVYPSKINFIHSQTHCGMHASIFSHTWTTREPAVWFMSESGAVGSWQARTYMGLPIISSGFETTAGIWGLSVNVTVWLTYLAFLRSSP